MTWVEDLISRLQAAPDGKISVILNNQTIILQVTKDLILFFVANQALLARVGKEAFRDFLLLVHEKKDEEAFNLLLARMTAQDIIDRMNANAQGLSQNTDDREKFLAALEQFFLKTLAPDALKVLIGMLV